MCVYVLLQQKVLLPRQRRTWVCVYMCVCMCVCVRVCIHCMCVYVCESYLLSLSPDPFSHFTADPTNTTPRTFTTYPTYVDIYNLHSTTYVNKVPNINIHLQHTLQIQHTCTDTTDPTNTTTRTYTTYPTYVYTYTTFKTPHTCITYPTYIYKHKRSYIHITSVQIQQTLQTLHHIHIQYTQHIYIYNIHNTTNVHNLLNIHTHIPRTIHTHHILQTPHLIHVQTSTPHLIYIQTDTTPHTHTNRDSERERGRKRGREIPHLIHIHRKSSLYLPLGSVNLVLKAMGTPDENSSPPG